MHTALTSQRLLLLALMQTAARHGDGGTWTWSCVRMRSFSLLFIDFLLIRSLHLTQQTRLFHQFVEQASALHQVRRRVKLLDAAVLQYHNPVTVQDGVDTMRDC